MFYTYVSCLMLSLISLFVCFQSGPTDLRHFDPEFTHLPVSSSLCTDSLIVSSSVKEAAGAFPGFSYGPPSELSFMWSSSCCCCSSFIRNSQRDWIKTHSVTVFFFFLLRDHIRAARDVTRRIYRWKDSIPPSSTVKFSSVWCGFERKALIELVLNSGKI